MPELIISPTDFIPTVSLRGGGIPFVFRGKNMVIRGEGEESYLTVYAGSKDLNETYDISGETLTGTIAWTANNEIITGTGTSFNSQLHNGQMIIAGTEVFSVKLITDDTHFISDKIPTTSLSGQAARFMRTLSEVDRKRASLRRGSIVKIDKGDLLFNGDGQLYLNGAATGFTATRKPKRLQRDNAGAYTEFPLGFASPPPVPVITAVSGGVKRMMDGKYSFLVSYYNTRTRGFSNPSPAIKRNGSSVDLEIDVDTAKTRFEFDFTLSLVGKPTNADAFLIWGSQSGGGVADTNASNFNNGAWYRAAIIKIADLAAGDIGYLEYLDSELGEVASGDNDEPPECEFLAEFSNVPFYISALGNTKTGNPLGTSPGNYVLPTKNSNREAAPYAWRTSVGDEITGFALGIGRMFCQTINGIPFVTATGNTEVGRLTPFLQDYPFTSRPYLTKGGISPYNLTVIQGDVFSLSGGQPLMTPRGASDQDTRPFELGKKIKDLTKNWRDGLGIVKEDPKNQQACYIQAGTRKNASGYWESDIFPFNLQTNTWMPPVVLSSTTRDMIVSGAAIVNNRLEFLAGGRTSTGGYELRTYRYDEQSGETVPFYFATQFSDFGLSRRAKKITRQTIYGRFSTLNFSYHGADAANRNVITSDIENGTNPLSGTIVFTGGGTEIERTIEKRHLTKNIDEVAMRVAGTWDGIGEPDRIDKIVLVFDEMGRAR